MAVRVLKKLSFVLAAALLVAPVVAQEGTDGDTDAALNSNVDHRAHAVTGGPYFAYSEEGTNATVQLDGQRSHSHYFNPADGTTGKIVKYLWTVDEEVVCEKVMCKVEFSHGKKNLILRVEDNTGSEAFAQTRVVVRNSEMPKMRAWHYTGESNEELFSEQPPIFSEDVPTAGSGGVPEFLYGKRTQSAYFGLIRVSTRQEYRLRVVCRTGQGYCFGSLTGRRVFHGANGGTSKPVNLSPGFHPIFASFMQREASVEGFLKLQWSEGGGPFVDVPAANLFHVPSSFAPVINWVTPSSITPGSILTLRGTGFSARGVRVRIAGVLCASITLLSDRQLTCVVPAVSTGKERTVRVSSRNGKSNRHNVEVRGGAQQGVGYFQDPSFYETHFKRDAVSNEPYELKQIASITYGPDGRYYLGTLNGFVHAIRVDDEYVVTEHCVSEHLGDQYSILGLAFNPVEFPKVKLYAAVSVLYWQPRHNLPLSSGWRNGRIITMEPNRGGKCLGVTNDGLVTGLPVSNRDHGLNQVRFDDDGNLLLSVGGSTNGGKHVGGTRGSIGGVPDSPLSGAMLKIPVLKANFNGKITYTNPSRPDLTDVEDGVDVEAYADGLRNAYTHVLHSNGKHYAVDNGANDGFGPFSTGCGEEDTRESIRDGDALRLLEKGGFHGYANINRGRQDPRQCVHRDFNSPAGNGYKPALEYFESSTTALLEWTTNTFGGSMRGNLIASKFAIQGKGKSYRVILGDGGNSVQSSYMLARYSGLASQLTPFGGIAFARVQQNHVAVLASKEENPGIVTVSAVFPTRGPRKGGQRVLVTGWNLQPPLTATVGGKPCADIGDFSSDGRSFKCTTPSGSGKVPVIVVSGNSASQSWGWEYWYTNL